VLIYSFSLHNDAGGDHETVGRMALAHDKAARAFGKLVIQDMIRGDGLRYTGWAMEWSQGRASGLQHSLSPSRGTNPFRRTWIG
jgi:hypothetical protein